MSTQNTKAVSSGGEFTTTAPVVAPVLAHQVSEPDIYWAMPGPGRTLQGLRRGAIYSLIRDREIESFVVRRKNHSRGRRLIVADSLVNYLRRLRFEQNGGTEAAK